MQIPSGVLGSAPGFGIHVAARSNWEPYLICMVSPVTSDER